VLHPAGPVAAALLSIAESRRLRGSDLLHAFVLGVEVEARILEPRVADYKFAWSPTTTVGAFGAAAAIGTVLGLNESQLSWALGIAASQACGLRETGGSMAKAYNAGHAARCGMVAAMLAERGFTGPERALEGPNGFLAAFGSPRDPSMIVRDWATGWHISRNTFKAFPCGIVTHPAIDAALQLKRTHRFDAEAIDTVALRVHPVALRLTGRRTPSSPLEAKLSVFHCVATALVYGRLGVAEFSPACIEDPRVLALRDGMLGEQDDAMPIDAAAVEVRLRDGTALRLDLDHAIGSAARPMTDADLNEKVCALAQGVLPRERCETLIDRLWRMDELEDSGTLARLATP
jgi:2-methylcitrate dehydratase PrpD